MMRKVFVLYSALIICTISFAQSSARSSSRYFNIQKVLLPPELQVVENSIHFHDTDGNNVINANETSSISLSVKNTGRGGAYGCTAKIQAVGATDGLRFTNQDLAPIPVGETKVITFPIQATESTTTGTAQFTIQIDEPNGFGTDPVQLNVKTHKFDSPMIEIVSYKIISGSDAQLRKKRAFKLQVLVQNTDQGEARDIAVTMRTPENMFNLNANQTINIPVLLPNQTETLEYELQTNANIPDDISLSFHVTESYGRFAKDGEIPLHFGQAINSGLIALNIVGQDKENIQITKGSLISDVDENIPQTKEQNNNTFVVIIANEMYKHVAPVRYALNDGTIFRKYCTTTLGISEKHIKYAPNASYMDIKDKITWLQNMTEANDNAHIIFYYTGHGIPDEASRSAYLLPSDGNGSDVSTCYQIDQLFSALGNMPTERVTIFLDACFSGSAKDGKMIASAKGVALKAKSGVPVGNTVVFSAAQGDQTAAFFDKQQHGLFTYWLLKKMQQTAGDISYAELGDYILTNVKRSAMDENGKPQTPTTTASSSLGDSWKSWKLK